jgi:hypothetical protein
MHPNRRDDNGEGASAPPRVAEPDADPESDAEDPAMMNAADNVLLTEEDFLADEATASLVYAI